MRRASGGGGGVGGGGRGGRRGAQWIFWAPHQAYILKSNLAAPKPP